MLSPFVATFLELLVIVLGIVMFVVIAHIVVSWLVHFQVLNLRQPLVSQIWYMLNRLVEPMYRPIRRFMPDLGGIDLAPMVVILIVIALRSLAERYYIQLGF